jgi:L-ascorbate metabolism protein UlaG (beta-lactamase superfamily)
MKTYAKGKFSGEYDTSTNVNLRHILKWKLFEHAPKIWQKQTEVKALELQCEAEKLSQEKDFICWLSHAGFLIQLGGKRFLLDPVFANIPFYKRQISVPYSVDELGDIDYLLLSHVHYDHFDKKSIKALATRSLKAILPLKMSKILHQTSDMETEELDWYECYDDEDVQITLVPAKHWGRRGLFDKNEVLWGGYVLTYQGKSIYFAGDTAVGEHFKEIGQRFNIEYALLPIGAYKPEFIMKYNHLNPQEAFEAFKQLQAKIMIPMHYGTFKLTDEPMDEPLKWIKEIDKENPNKIKILKVGEVLSV